MCLRHWRMVPRVVQQAVWRTYRPGQCDDMRVSSEWLTAATAAVGFVARREGYHNSPNECQAMETFMDNR